jgi:hypothetical protein
LRLAASTWWVLPGQLPTIVLADTQPSGDLKCMIPGHQAIGLFKI